MTPDEELVQIAERLDKAADPAILETDGKKLDALIAAAEQVGKSFSGSWLGYHSRVYYADLRPVPAGARFSQEWGLMDAYSMGSRGDWREFDDSIIEDQIRRIAGDPDLTALEKVSDEADDVFNSAKSDIASILVGLSVEQDKFVERLSEQLDTMMPLNASEILQVWMPKGQVMTRDMPAMGQGMSIPPHFAMLARLRSLSHSFGNCRSAAEIARKLAAHLARGARRRARDVRIGTNVFIGHGRSAAWRELKDFVQDRLRLPYDEYNRVPVAGVTNIARLSEMLDAAAIALLVMTAEDEMAEGKTRARENVVHEVGLFQGRLGFTRAIILIEEGCEEFSNIHGLGQIRFEQGKITGAFELVRQVMEREGLIEES